MAGNDKNWCFAWFAAPIPTSGETRAALVKDSKWEKGATISISFLDGTEAQKALVRRFAPEWIQNLAHLQFSWQAPPNTEIRISFQYQGSWSVIGTTAKSIPKNQPTMNFGWLTPGVSDDEGGGSFCTNSATRSD
jgi:serralysin